MTTNIEKFYKQQNNFEDALNEMSKPIPKHLIKQRAGYRDRNGNQHYVDYIEWHTACDILDTVYPAWTHKVLDVQEVGAVLIITAQITIEGVQREGLGTGDLSKGELGIKKAEHDALKRAAVKFGIGRELYLKDDSSGEQHSSGSPNQSRQSNHSGGGQSGQRQYDNSKPDSLTTGDAPTAKQIAMIKAICKDLQSDTVALIQQIWHVHLDNLSKRGASYIISQLQTYEKDGLPFEIDEEYQDSPDDNFKYAVSKSDDEDFEGEAIKAGQINAITNLAKNRKKDVGQLVKEYTGGRTDKLDFMLSDEAARLIQALNDMK